MICYDLIFHDCYFGVNINSYTTQIQSYMTVRKIIQNAEQNDEWAKHKWGPWNISVYNNIFDTLKSPFFENENGIITVWWILV